MNKNADWHVCLISAQPLANLGALLSAETKPRRALFLVTPQMHEAAAALEAVVVPAGVQVERMDISQAHMKPVSDQLLDWLLQHEGETVWLNATGGSKPMSFAAISAFEAAGRRNHIFYVHQDTGNAERLFPSAQDDAAAASLSFRPTLRQYIEAHGFEMSATANAAVDAAERDALDRLVSMARSHGEALGALNFEVHAVLDRQPRTESGPIEVPLPAAHKTHLQRLIDQFADMGRVARLGSDRLRFVDRANALYVAGGWLERHTYQKLSSVAAELRLRDVSCSVTVSHGGTKNELDVLAVRGSRLFAIECKARAETADGRGSTHALYKLDSLGRLGGRLNMRSMVVSYRHLNEDTKRRAKDLGIDVVDASALGSLTKHLRSWIGMPTGGPQSIGPQSIV